ncbi:MAG: deoxyribose-phosphate aldolase [Acidimicrobiales bacterium]
MEDADPVAGDGDTEAESRRKAAARALRLLDLTSLGADDRPADIDALCDAAVTPHGSVAAVCVWPRFVTQAVDRLTGTGVAVCAVANFPEGGDDPSAAVEEALAIMADGGDEVDVVVPWRELLAGRSGAVEALVATVRRALDPGVGLKAILETGELDDAELIARAAREALDGGAGFLKTSTGKTARSATPEAAATLLAVLAERRAGDGSGASAGIKISGGVRDLAAATGYLALADDVMGPDWADPAHFRFGASGLLDDLLRQLG